MLFVKPIEHDSCEDQSYAWPEAIANIEEYRLSFHIDEAYARRQYQERVGGYLLSQRQAEQGDQRPPEQHNGQNTNHREQCFSPSHVLACSYTSGPRGHIVQWHTGGAEVTGRTT